MTAPDPPTPPTRSRKDHRESHPEPDPPWLPDESAVLAEATFTGPSGQEYRVLRTTESDAYDEHPDHDTEEDAPAADPSSGPCHDLP